jgi:prepilin-type N-terminal cleavage/methylation domain-containing protein
MHDRPMTVTARRSAFTLLEVMVAVTIFALVSLIIFTVFRSAIRSHEAGERGAENIQRARFAVDSLRKDSMNVFFRDETSYNIAMTSMIENMEQLRLQAEESGDWSQYDATYGDPSDPDSVENASIGSPFEKGRIIDLQFKGTDGGELDTLTFATQTPLKRGALYRPWGISRVTYKVDGDWLIRTSDTVETEKRDSYGEVIEKKGPAEFVKLADGVTSFDIKYAFWYDNQWYEADSWDSTARQIRNSRYILGEHDYETETNASGLQPGDAGWNRSLNDQYAEPLDRLPAYMRLHLVFADKKNPGRVEDYLAIIRLYGAEETYTPGPELNEEMREEERITRDDTYLPVYPGVLKKE